MGKRLQVIIGDEEFAEIRRAARHNHMTSSEWIRQVLRKAYRSEPLGDARKKIEIVQRAAEYAFPTADLDEMLER